MRRASALSLFFLASACSVGSGSGDGDSPPVTCDEGVPVGDAIANDAGFVAECETFKYENAGLFFVIVKGKDAKGGKGVMTLLWTDQDAPSEAPDPAKTYLETDVNSSRLSMAQGVYLDSENSRAIPMKSTLTFKQVPTSTTTPYEIAFEFKQALESAPSQEMTFSGTLTGP